MHSSESQRFQRQWWVLLLAVFAGPSHAGEVPQDIDGTPATVHRITDDASFGATAQLQQRSQGNFDLKESKSDTETFLAPKLDLAGIYAPVPWVRGLLSVELSTVDQIGEDSAPTSGRTELSQAFITLSSLYPGLALHFGKGLLRDERRWLYDASLDQVRAEYRYRRGVVTAALIGQGPLFDGVAAGGTRNKSLDYLLYWQPEVSRRTRVAGYIYARDDLSGRRDDALFLGLRLTGDMGRDFRYWLDTATLGGERGDTRLNGLALDIGGVYTWDWVYPMGVTLAYANGSGDNDPDPAVDSSFRQTGMQTNNDRVLGVVRVKYYGELMDPELSNLSVLTLGAGLRPTDESSLEFYYHRYTQNEATPALDASALNSSPDGRHTDVGVEWDFVAGYRAGDVELKGVLAYYAPGEAFASPLRKPAYFSELQWVTRF